MNQIRRDDFVEDLVKFDNDKLLVGIEGKPLLKFVVTSNYQL